MKSVDVGRLVEDHQPKAAEIPKASRSGPHVETERVTPRKQSLGPKILEEITAASSRLVHAEGRKYPRLGWPCCDAVRGFSRCAISAAPRIPHFISSIAKAQMAFYTEICK